MGMLASLERLAPPRAPQKLNKPQLEVVAEEIKTHLEEGNYETVDIGLTTPVAPEEPVEKQEEEEETEVNPILLAILEDAIDVFDALTPLEQAQMIAELARINSVYSKED